MRVFYSFIRATIKGVMDLNDAHNGGESKINICYRCKIQAESIKTYCLHCNKVKYCSPQCMKKNKQLHDLMCRIYLEQYPIINETCKGMRDNYENVKNLEKRKKKK